MIIVVAATKGGVGKTTIATNLVAIDVAGGHDSILVDADRQGSAAAWSEVRDSSPALVRVPTVQKYGKGLLNELRELNRKYDNVWVDVGGHDSEEMRSALLAGDLLLVPIRPAQLDVWSLPRILEIVGQAQSFNEKLKYFFVVNGAHTSPNVKDANEIAELLGEYPLCRSVIHHRRAFAKAPVSGMGVVDMKGDDRDEKAVSEMMALYEEVLNG